MALTVIDALRRFLPTHRRNHHHAMNPAQRRATWAITHCRTAEMGGHLHACAPCLTRQFHFHSCNHRSCPQCGKDATVQWIERELGKRVGAPYFMVTFTLPEELRSLFFTNHAKDIYQLFFHAASSALSDCLANPRWLGAKHSGFTMVLHTWNQRLHFHPHIHCIVPGAGIDTNGRVVTVKNANFLVPQPALRRVFRARFRDRLAALEEQQSREAKPLRDPPSLPPSGQKTGVWIYAPLVVVKTSSNTSAATSPAPPLAIHAWYRLPIPTSASAGKPRTWRRAKNRDARRRRVCRPLPPPCPATRSTSHTPLRLLPSSRQSQTRAHRFSHRAAIAHRHVRNHHPAQASAHHRLPLLRRAHDKTPTASPRVETKPTHPRPASSKKRHSA